MNFRVGQRYKTRDGGDALIVYDFGDEALFPLLGVIDDQSEPERWTRDGRWIDESESTHDLIETGLTTKVWLNFNEEDGELVFDGAYDTFEDAEQCAAENRVSRFPVEVREGEFLE